ncbi:MAG: protein kinase [Lentisphaeraceae bacterium]|nr:protein kinase [Lentisphaeraceae bacterium]
MDEDFQKFLHSQFSEAHDNMQDPHELSALMELKHERYGEKYLIAEGGQKKVFKCTDELTGRSIAYATVKDPDNNETTAKFIREARLTAHLEHPHIIPVYDTGLDDSGIPYFTMKYISGQSYEDYLKENHTLQENIDILIKICEAVTFAHYRGIIHFDIKPDNIQVSDYGEVLLCDWGLAGIAYESCSQSLLDDDILKQVDLSQSIDLYFKGTAGYAAPEMWKKQTHRDHLCDIYSLGAVLYQILSKNPPGQTLFFKDMKGPEALKAVCKKALSNEKEKRYQSAQEFLNELLAWRNGFATKAEEASFATTFKLLILRHKNVSISILTSLIFIFVLTLIFVIFIHNKEKRSTALANALQKTELERNALEQELAPKYIEKATDALSRREYAAALALCDHVLRYDPDSQEARSIVGMIHFCKQEFKEAIPYLKGNILAIAKNFHDLPTPLPLEDIIYIITNLDRTDENGEQVVYKNMLFEEFERDHPIEEIRELMLAELHHKNPTFKHINLNIEETSEGWLIDVSNNIGLAELYILQKLGPIYVKSLDMTNTQVGRLVDTLQYMQIEELIIKNWEKTNLDFLKNRRILHLDVQGSKIDFSKVIEELPLVTLNIAETPFKNWSVLKDLRFLKEVTVSKGAMPLHIRQAISSKVNIVEI